MKRAFHFLLLVLIVFTAFGAGTFFGRSGPSTTFITDVNQEMNRGVSWQNGFDAAHDRLRSSGLIPPTGPTLSLDGTITAINGTTLTITTSARSYDPLDAAWPTTRTVTPNKNTPIFRLTNQGQQKMQAALAAGKPISRDEAEEAASQTDLQTGKTIQIESATDIATAETITLPSRITILEIVP